MPLLEVKNLHVEIDAKKILNGLDLTIEKGKVHASMGPEMGEVIEEEWPELVHKLPPKKPHG